jgi:arylsulfatase A-like enzyme
MTTYSRRAFLKAAGAAAAAAMVPRWLAAGQPSAKRLNFVFVLMDDLGQRDIGAFGSTFYETPNIDRLAAEGMRFTSGYAACPVCSPTRASIMAGKYPARVNITNFIAGMKSGKLVPPQYRHELPLEEFTVGEAMKDGGYTTCFIGKWHLGGPEYYPDKQGFQTTVAVAGGSGYFSPYKNFLKDTPPGEYLTDRLTDEALKFIDAETGLPKVKESAAPAQTQAPRANGGSGGGARRATPAAATELKTVVQPRFQIDAPPCPVCGSIMTANGACYKCDNCGATSGCS